MTGNAQELKKLKKDELVELYEERIGPAGDLTKDELVEALSVEEHADSPEVLAKVEDSYVFEYVGDPGCPPPAILHPFLEETKPLEPGTRVEVPESCAKNVALNRNFKPSGKAAEDYCAEVLKQEERNALEARAALTGPVDGVSGDAETEAKIERLLKMRPSARNLYEGGKNR